MTWKRHGAECGQGAPNSVAVILRGNRGEITMVPTTLLTPQRTTRLDGGQTVFVLLWPVLAGQTCPASLSSPCPACRAQLKPVTHFGGSHWGISAGTCKERHLWTGGKLCLLASYHLVQWQQVEGSALEITMEFKHELP